MTGAEVLDVARDAIITLVLVSSPLMLIELPATAATASTRSPLHRSFAASAL